MKRTSALVATAILAFTGSITAPAISGEWTHTSMGGKVTVSGPTLHLRDNAKDGRFVTSEYRYNNGNSTSAIANKAGYGKTVSVTQSSNITNSKICRSQTFPLPVDCGSWKF